jgi:hypothetical protein
MLATLQTDWRQTGGRLQAQFNKHAYKLRKVQIWITEVWLGRQDLHDEIRTGRPHLNDLDVKILAILNKYPFESARSIAETQCIAHSTKWLHLHDSIGFGSFHLHWVPHILTHDLRENEKSVQKQWCHSGILPNMMAGIILWPMISRGFSWIHQHVACGLCREIAWSQSRDLIFRSKIHVYDRVELERLLCCRQTPKWH